MAVSQTPRMALTRWSAGTDPFTRTQLDDDHAQLETLAAGYLRDTLANRPAAGDANVGFLYEATDTGRLYWSTGAAWVEVARQSDIVTDHGALTGLSHNDHPQYQLASSAMKITTGSYSGSGAASRTISVPFTPKFVMLSAEGTIMSSPTSPHFSFSPPITGSGRYGFGYRSGGGSSGAYPSMNDDERPRPVTNGFVVGHDTSRSHDGGGSTNNASWTYRWLAIA